MMNIQSSIRFDALRVKGYLSHENCFKRSHSNQFLFEKQHFIVTQKAIIVIKKLMVVFLIIQVHLSSFFIILEKAE